jgi:hypothetical protein
MAVQQRTSAASDNGAERGSKSKEKTGLPGTNGTWSNPFNFLIDQNGSAVHTALESSAAMFRGVVKIGEEMANFTSKRLQAQMEGGLAAMVWETDPKKVVARQTEFIRDTGEAWRVEIDRLAKLSDTTVHDVMNPITQYARSTLRGFGQQ